MAENPTQSPPKPKNASPKKKGGAGSAPMTIGFALMSILPILLAVYLLSQPGGGGSVPLAGRQSLVLGLMLASALAGFAFIKAELAKVFRQIVDQASRSATGGLKDSLREISQDEIARITGTIEQITARFDDGNAQARRTKEGLRKGLGTLAEALQVSKDPNRLAEMFTEGAREAVDAKTAYFVGIDEDAGDFFTVASCGEAAEEVRELRIALGEGVPGLAARERAPLLLHDHEGKGKAGFGLATAPRSTIASPVQMGESLYGVLILHDRSDGGRFDEDDLIVISGLSTLVASALANRERYGRLEDSFDQVIRSFSKAIESRDPYARGHAERVAVYCAEMARSLRLDEETIRTLRRAAYLLGVGRINLPESLLRKEGKYTPEELEHVQNYPIKSEEIIQDIPALAAVRPMVRHHLEMADGSGGPDGIRGEDIPLTTHILIVANAFDAMTSDRSYRQAVSLPDALRRLQEGAGKVYDRRAVQALVELDERILKGTAVSTSGGSVKGQGAASISVMD